MYLLECLTYPLTEIMTATKRDLNECNYLKVIVRVVCVPETDFVLCSIVSSISATL